MADELQILLVRTRSQYFRSVLQHRAQVEIDQIQIELIRLHFGEIKNVVDQAQ